MKIAVIMGGDSPEKEISIKTGNALAAACRKLGHKVDLIKVGESIEPLIPVLKKVDLVVNALHGGDGENGIVSGLLKQHGIAFTGSGQTASALCMDKHKSKTLVKNAGYLTPTWINIRRNTNYLSKLRETGNLGFPLVVKPNSEGSTLGLTINQNLKDLKDGIKLAFDHDSSVLIEKYIPGREITISILGQEVLPIVEIVPVHEFYDYECKYSQGMSSYFCPAEINDILTGYIQKTALKIHNLLGCSHYSRVDFRLNGDKFWFLEVNTLPGMTETSLVPKAAEAAGYSFEDLVEKIIQEAWSD
ncbi:MAG: D-alanine--D-alanine ligase [Candidatus Neomarinimicrobiota bacterium]